MKYKRKNTKDLNLLCKKNVHFINFDNEIYSQADDVAMGSPLGSIFAGTIMVQLLSFLKGYVDDTFTFHNEQCITFVLEQLNSLPRDFTAHLRIRNRKKTTFSRCPCY